MNSGDFTKPQKTKMAPFKFPPIYSYPPFWTIQINPKTRQKQLEFWSNLICAFMASINKTEMDTVTTMETPLFKNAKLGKKLSKESVDIIIEFMISQNKAKWLDDQHIRARIVWKTPLEMGMTVWRYADSTGQLKIMMTYEELINGDETEGQTFHKMSIQAFDEAMHALEEAGKAKVMPSKHILESGVKFI